MAAHKVTLSIDQGATFRKSLIWRAGPTAESAEPVDLTDCSALAHVRSEVDSDEVLLTLSSAGDGDGLITLGDETGEILIEIDAQTTASIDWDSAVYDLEITFPDGTVVRRMAGTVKVSKEVTRG